MWVKKRERKNPIIIKILPINWMEWSCWSNGSWGEGGGLVKEHARDQDATLACNLQQRTESGSKYGIRIVRVWPGLTECPAPVCFAGAPHESETEHVVALPVSIAQLLSSSSLLVEHTINVTDPSRSLGALSWATNSDGDSVRAKWLPRIHLITQHYH